MHFVRRFEVAMLCAAALLVGLDVGLYHVQYAAWAAPPRAGEQRLLRRAADKLQASQSGGPPVEAPGRVESTFAALRAAVARLSSRAEALAGTGGGDAATMDAMQNEIATVRRDLDAARARRAAAAEAPLGAEVPDERPPTPTRDLAERRRPPAARRAVPDVPQQPPEGGGGAPLGPAALPLGSDSVLLMICHARANAIKRSLEAIVRHHPCGDGPRVVVSQDGGNAPGTQQLADEVAAAARALAVKCPGLAPLRHFVHAAQTSGGDGYHKLARHYGFAFRTAFQGQTARTIVVEEDLQIAPDFFEFFAATAPILDTDATLMAVSAWNDNGQKGSVSDAAKVLRSDFFPGLGWMVNRKVWTDELEQKWPEAYWDDWLREPPQRRDRAFLRPEVCRTYHFSTKGGTSNNQYGGFLERTQLNDDFVPFRQRFAELKSSLAPRAYDEALLRDLRAAQLVASVDALKRLPHPAPTALRIEYDRVDDSRSGFPALARALGVMDNVKAGVPRAAYRGVVEFSHEGTRVFLAPKWEVVEQSLDHHGAS